MDIDSLYLKWDEPIQGCLIALRQLILSQDELVWETVKYGAPCFMYKKRMFAYLMVEKQSNQPYILVVEGNRIDHSSLEQGDRKRMKIVRIDANVDIQVEKVNEILSLALDLYKNGVVKS